MSWQTILLYELKVVTYNHGQDLYILCSHNLVKWKQKFYIISTFA